MTMFASTRHLTLHTTVMLRDCTGQVVTSPASTNGPSLLAFSLRFTSLASALPHLACPTVQDIYPLPRGLSTLINEVWVDLKFYWTTVFCFEEQIVSSSPSSDFLSWAAISVSSCDLNLGLIRADYGDKSTLVNLTVAHKK